ncbi:hypothetical protein [Prosthecobacter sp.]|uniref:hypothetical protein n=1 Tax=Prosthecobacter sp. TaxID=1965333 RepID=UPI00248903DE|nr:hypothetical protein [Prosthecobacter sp.]MDI1312696.1 hypothetical protein [Prosthecobacter sp.]
MKHIAFQALLYTGVLLQMNPVFAQRVEATSTVITSEGTISEFGPQGVVIKSEAGSQPVRFISSETTNYVDENGNPVAVELVKSGLPATIYYTKVGDTLIASKIMVRTSATTSTKVVATTPAVTVPITAGVITQFGPENLIIKTESAPDPLSYSYSKTTTYVDETGAPVAIETVRSGVPVTVHYTKVGNTLVASKVIVRKNAVVPEQLIEKKTTTTTTTRN